MMILILVMRKKKMMIKNKIMGTYLIVLMKKTKMVFIFKFLNIFRRSVVCSGDIIKNILIIFLMKKSIIKILYFLSYD